MMMPLDICIESYGAAVHVVDSLLSSGLYLSSRRSPSTPSHDHHLTADHSVLDDAVRAASEHLNFKEAQAIWLVDVCSCTYDAAAVEARTTRGEIADRVAHGRRCIRAGLPAASTPQR